MAPAAALRSPLLARAREPDPLRAGRVRGIARIRVGAMERA
jgi:hypothetical protein